MHGGKVNCAISVDFIEERLESNVWVGDGRWLERGVDSLEISFRSFILKFSLYSVAAHWRARIGLDFCFICIRRIGWIREGNVIREDSFLRYGLKKEGMAI